MIVKSRVSGENALAIFESFHADRMLPKFRAAKKASQTQEAKKGGVNQEMQQDGPAFESSDGIFINTTFPLTQWANPSDNMESKEPWGWRERLVRRVEKMLGISRRQQREVHGNGNPLEILLSVRGSLQEAQDYTVRIKAYEAAIKQAINGGQTARVNKLMKACQVVQQESILIATGFKQYLSEKQVIEFAVKCKKGLRLDWVENFSRPIPEAVLKRKVEADALKVFDNYVVLHYDPKAKAFELTPAQVAAKKDPILFGVIEDVRKLYFIGDWKDDECDLTMEEVAKVLGRPPNEISEDPTADEEP